MKKLTLLAILLICIFSCKSVYQKKIVTHYPDNKTTVTDTTETRDVSVKKEDSKTFLDTLKGGFATIKDFIIFWDNREEEE